MSPLRARGGRRRGDDRLYDPDPLARLEAARALAPRDVARRSQSVAGWPPSSPGARNAFLLLVTTKPPDWRDPLLAWPDGPLTLGTPHEGFLYPDPIGFWAEVRAWATALLRGWQPAWSTAEALSSTALVQSGGDPAAIGVARATCRPGVVLFLDEPAWQAVATERTDVRAHHVPDPHREGQVYQGWWARAGDEILGKAPQHPTMHRFYRRADMESFLAGAAALRSD